MVEGFLSLVRSGKYGTGTLVIRLEPWVCFGAWTCVRGRKGCAGVLDLGGGEVSFGNGKSGLRSE